jgi:Ran GTPase-activating protein (RanGAP) involved in mRNA processing and transport
VPDSNRLEIAEALAQNTIVRRIALKTNNYDKESANAMAKYLAQSKHLLAVELSQSFRVETVEECPHQQFLSTFIEAIGQSNSVKPLELTYPSLGRVSASFENMLTRTKNMQSLSVDLEREGYLEKAATAAMASGFSRNATLREISLVDWQETSQISVLTALRDHPVVQ